MNESTARENIKQFVNNRDYTYSVEEMLDSYTRYYLKGSYISYTMQDCVKHLSEELETLHRLEESE